MGRGDRRDERGGLLDLGEGAESGMGRDEIGRLEGGATEPSTMHLPRARVLAKRMFLLANQGKLSAGCSDFQSGTSTCSKRYGPRKVAKILVVCRLKQSMAQIEANAAWARFAQFRNSSQYKRFWTFSTGQIVDL
jgi:hypothetical protein